MVSLIITATIRNSGERRRSEKRERVVSRRCFIGGRDKNGKR
jgi:hypothetical protein